MLLLCHNQSGLRDYWAVAMLHGSPAEAPFGEVEAARIVAATRTESEFRAGASVRGGLALRTAAQARALVNGRDFVLPDDVTELVQSVLAHRLALARQSGDALEERRTVGLHLKRILSALPPPV